MTWGVYLIVGIFGSIGILGNKKYLDPPKTILNLFPSTAIGPFIVEILLTIQLSTIYPFLCYLSKN